MTDSTTYYGLAEDPWPYEYVVAGLQFFALSAKRLDAYLPEPFPETGFDLASGFFSTGSPLHAAISIFRMCINPGQTWNDWIDDESKEDDAVEELFAELCECVDQAYFGNDKDDIRYRQLLVANAEDRWVAKMNECRERATLILRRIGWWYEPDTPPAFSAAEIFDQESSGMYSENLMRSRFSGDATDAHGSAR